jgi:peptidoglycan/LPS O-acetylase OafA/YrhL
MGVRAEVGSIPALDGMRGIAVLWVILFHYAIVRGAADPWVAAMSSVAPIDALVRNGYLGVDLFFLISGFLLTLPWLARAARGAPPPATREFWTRRVRRIVPAYYVHLVLLFALFMPLVRGWDYWRWDFFVVVWNALAHASFLQLTSPLTSGAMGVNGALWTLAIEAQFYLLLPLLAPLFTRAPLRTSAVALAISIAWQLGAQQGLDGLVALQLRLGAHWRWSEETVRHLLSTQLPGYLGHFALGALLGRGWLALRAPPSRALSHALALAGLAALAVLTISLASGAAPWGRFTWLLRTFTLATMLLAAAAGTGPVSGYVLARGPLAHAGRVSYSAYLYHLPLLLLWHRWAGMGPASLPAYLSVVLAAAWLSWRYVEQPFLLGGARARAHGEREGDGGDLQRRHAP